MKNILVTGVSTGIGYDAVRYFIQEGYRVFGSVRRDTDIAKLEENFPKNFICLQFDIANLEQIETAREKVERLLDGDCLVALVNNAGFAQGGRMALLADPVFRQQMEVNLFGVRNVTNAFLPLLGACKKFKGGPGKIINISSISGIFNTSMYGTYRVAKHALESMGEVYRRELMMYGIRVSSIQLCPIKSDLWNKNLDSTDEYLGTDYGKMAYKTNQIIRASQIDAVPVEAISVLIDKIIKSKRPRLSYIITKNKIINVLVAKFLPKCIADYIIYRSLNR